MNTFKTLAVASTATLLLLSGQAWSAQEADHAQHHPAPASTTVGEAAPAVASHAEKMEQRMAKVEIVVNRLTKKMDSVKETLAQAKQASGAERNQLLARHGEGLREVLQGLRELTLKSMSKEKMAEMMGGGTSPSGGMMGMGAQGASGQGGMMAGMNMEEHHELMEKRLALLFDLMEQMMEHGNVAATPAR